MDLSSFFPSPHPLCSHVTRLRHHLTPRSTEALLPEKCSATHMRSSLGRAVSFIHVPNVFFILITSLGLISDLIRHSEEIKPLISVGDLLLRTFDSHMQQLGGIPFFGAGVSLNFLCAVPSLGTACSGSESRHGCDCRNSE